MTCTIVIPLPPRILSPNARSHYMAKAKSVKQYRDCAKWSAIAEINKVVTRGFKPQWDKATAQITWVSKTARFPDADNCLASMKAAFDGLADAGLLSDDRGLTHLPVKFAVDKKLPRIILTITNTP